MKRPQQDNNRHWGSYAGCSCFCCENCRREELWGFCYRVEAQDITEPFQQLALQCKCKNLGLSCKYKYYAIDENEHDPCHWMNNLSGWKRTQKKLVLDWESNPDLCNDWKLWSVHWANQANLRAGHCEFVIYPMMFFNDTLFLLVFVVLYNRRSIFYFSKL